MKALVTVFLVLMASHLSVAAPPEAEAMYRLPAHVVAPKGQLTLFADYDTAFTDMIPVFFVNRTGKSISLSAQDSDLYLKLEFKAEDGQWQRAQPHVFSRCGNSFFTHEIPPEHFIMILGYVPAQGRTADIRYSFYPESRGMHSNVGKGRVSFFDVDVATYDDMAILYGSYDYVVSLALGRVKGKNAPWSMLKGDSRTRAIFSLGRKYYDRDKVRAVLQKIAEGDEAEYAMLAKKMLARRERIAPASTGNN